MVLLTLIAVTVFKAPDVVQWIVVGLLCIAIVLRLFFLPLEYAPEAGPGSDEHLKADRG